MAGNVVIRTDNVAGALGILHTRILDAIVVDLRPDLLGHEAICTLRAARIALPLLSITARTAPDAYERAMSLGADGTAVLPLSNDEINAHLDALIDGSSSVVLPELCAGPLKLDLANRRVHARGGDVKVTEAEFAVLELLAIRNGAPVRVEAIQDRLQDIVANPDQKTITTIVNRLRRKLAPFEADKSIVKVRGLGFALRALRGADREYTTVSRLKLEGGFPCPSA
jgi:DNA-binding response OmpR family regulator